MNRTTICPSSETLSRVANATLPDEVLDEVLTHLEQCEECVTQLRRLDHDTVISRTVSSVATADAEGVKQLIGMLRNLGPHRSCSASETETATVAQGKDTTNIKLPDVSDPLRADELGQLGPYRLLRELGKGGMGVVYEAEDPSLCRHVALKVLQPKHAADPMARRRFLTEARAVAAIEHEHIVVIHQVGEDSGTPYLAMQLLRGESLATHLEHTPKLPLSEALRIARDTALGLSAAHSHQLIHRDVKPSNIWLDERNNRAKILDFGLARDLSADSHTTLNAGFIGTPAYMSPEQIDNQPLDPRTDLFSLGCVLYRMLTGVVPFTGETLLGTLTAICQAIPRDIQALDRNTPPEVARLINRLLAKDRNDRPGSADEVAVELNRILEKYEAQPVKAAPTDGSSSRRRWWVGLATAAAFTAIALGVWILVHDKEGREIARIRAEDGTKVTIQSDPAAANTKTPLDRPTSQVSAEADLSVKWPESSRNKKAYFDAQRATAAWALSQGAIIMIDTEPGQPATVELLPSSPFRVLSIEFRDFLAKELTEADFARLEDLPELTVLSIANHPISFATMERIGRLSRLQKLILDHCSLIDEMLAPLAHLKELEELSLGGNIQLSDDSFEHLRTMSKLRYLILYECRQIRGHRIHELQCLDSLILLRLDNAGQLTDEGLVGVGRAKVLQHVSLSGPFTDRGLAHLRGLRQLKGIGLNSKHITAAGVIEVIRGHDLETFDIANCEGCSTEQLIDVLCQQKSLKYVVLDKEASEKSVERLHAEVPGAYIQWIGKPYLPVQ